MKKKMILTLVLMSSFAFADMSKEEIVKQYKQSGNIPQNIPIALYQPLEKVIPKEVQKKIRAQKNRRKKQVKVESIADIFKDHPEGVDHGQFDMPVVRQVGPRCTAWGAMGTAENMLNRDGKRQKLSERAFWSTYHQYSGHAAMQAIVSHPLLPGELWGPNTSRKPANVSFERDGVAQVFDVEFLGSDPWKAVKAIVAGYAVYAASSVPVDMASCRTVLRINSNTSGGHAYELFSAFPAPSVVGGVLTGVKQTWGEDCGDQGKQYMPLIGYCEAPNNYCMFWIMKKVKRLK